MDEWNDRANRMEARRVNNCSDDRMVVGSTTAGGVAPPPSSCGSS